MDKVGEKSDAKNRPSNKKKNAPPTVRQTLTSYKRLMQANPLLKYEEEGIDIDKLLPALNNEIGSERPSLPPFRSLTNTSGKMTYGGAQTKKPPNFVRSQSLKLPKGAQKPVVTSNFSNLQKPTLPKPPIQSTTRPSTTSHQSKNSNFVRPTSSNVISSTRGSTKPSISMKNLIEQKSVTNNLSGRSSVNKVLPKSNYRPPTEVKSRYLQTATSVGTKQKNTAENKKSEVKSVKKTSLRRSLSSGHIQTKKGKQFDPQVAFSKLNTSRSEQNISLLGKPMFSPILEENGSKEFRNFVFKTPTAHERRSLCPKGRMSFQSSTPAVTTPHQHYLAKQLSTWLEKRGKRLSEFKHLRCFGVHDHHRKSTISVPEKEAFDEENKENVEVLNDRSESFEDLRIDNCKSNEANTDQEETKTKDIPKIFINGAEHGEKCKLNGKQIQDLHTVAKDALKELNKIIEEGYPKEHCVSWLELIREKYTELEDEPEYWECRAAIEKTAGNIGSAVEFYRNAIVQGAEVNTIEESLDSLLKKFSLLHLNSQPEKQLTKREKIEQDARNVFKSTIIQFALETKSKKTAEKVSQPSKKPQITPVRRSTRLSRSAYVSTPGLQLYDSLKELSPEQYDFKRNKALI